MQFQDPTPHVRSVGNVGAMIVNAIERHSARVAFECGGRQVTYREFGSDVSKILQLLDDLGVKAGQAVMQISGNSYEMFAVMAACYVGGYISVTPHYASSEEDHRYILENCEAVVLIADRQRAERAHRFGNESSRGLKVYSHVSDAGIPNLWDCLAPFSAGAIVPRDHPDDCIRVIYTGGTTGKPKGVITLSKQLAFASLLHIAEQPLFTTTRMLIALPLTHGAGSFIIPVLAKGGRCVMHVGFNSDRVLDAITKGEVTAGFFVPTVLSALLDNPRIASADLSAMQRIIYAGSPSSRDRIKQALALFGPILMQNYGQSEVPGTVLSLTPEEHQEPDDRLLSSAGRPYPCVTVRLLDDNGNDVTCGETGEICVRAPHATPGYWRMPQATEELWRHGWLHTGDMARKDESGYFYLVDRKKDMVITGGFNVYPLEVENVLLARPEVAAVAVIGVPDPKWGEALKAVVQLKPGCSIAEQDLIDFVKSKKGGVMTPKSIDFVAELPLTNLGKVDKKALRAPYWIGQQRAIH